MWTSQVYGHHDKMARTKTHRTSQNTELIGIQGNLKRHLNQPQNKPFNHYAMFVYDLFLC